MVTPRDGGGDEDKISLITAASTTPQESIESAQTGISVTDEHRKLEAKSYQKLGGGRTFSYRKRKPSCPNSLFTAPLGVNPHHMSSSSSRRNTDLELVRRRRFAVSIHMATEIPHPRSTITCNGTFDAWSCYGSLVS